MKRTESLLAELASGATVVDAAASAGVSTSTAFRRLRDPAFRKRLEAARDSYFAQTLSQLAAGSPTATAKIRELMGSDSPKIALAAAKAFLAFSLRYYDLVNVTARIDALEAKYDAAKDAQRRE